MAEVFPPDAAQEKVYPPLSLNYNSDGEPQLRIAFIHPDLGIGTLVRCF